MEYNEAREGKRREAQTHKNSDINITLGEKRARGLGN